MKKVTFHKQALATVMALMLALGLAACGTPTPPPASSPSAAPTAPAETPAIDTSKEVHLKLHVWGDAPVDKTPLEELSKLMKSRINATFEIVSMGWDSAAFELLFTSGEPLDLVYVGAADYPNKVRNGSLVALDDLLPIYAPQSLQNIPQSAWDEAVIDGKIYAIPFRFTEYIPGGIVYRGDLLKKYGMTEIKSIQDMAAYYDKVLSEEGGAITPFAPDTGWAGWYMGEMFINQTKGWVPIDLVNGLVFAGESFDKPENFLCVPFTDEFVEFAKLMKEWDTKGYWSKDVLSSTAVPYDSFVAGKAASIFQHAQGYIGTYGQITTALPASDPLYYSFPEANQKILKQPALANATAVSATCPNPERALMALDLLLNDKEVNQLVQYGIKGKNYDLDADGFKITPANYDDSKDSYGIGTWNLNVDEFQLPSRDDYPGKAELLARLGAIAKKNPYAGFAFDNTSVANEAAAIGQVNSEIGLQILFGKVDDPVKAVEDYRAQLTNAGVEKFLAELTKQYKAFSGK